MKQHSQIQLAELKALERLLLQPTVLQLNAD